MSRPVKPLKIQDDAEDKGENEKAGWHWENGEVPLTTEAVASTVSQELRIVEEVNR